MTARTFDVRMTPHPAELSRDGLLIVGLCADAGVRPQLVTVGSVSELEAAAAKVAADYGKPCAIWMRVTGRKPRGFDDESRRVGNVFRNAPEIAATREVTP